jgi:hypothetical protein
MTNRIINEYGASAQSEVTEALDKVIHTFEIGIKTIIEVCDLTPNELRCLTAELHNSVSATMAEHILRKGIAIRKAEREKKNLTTNPQPTKINL